MNIAELSIKKRTFFLFISLVLAAAGIISYFQMGKLEDPEFTIKTAIVHTPYPGASPTQVENEVSDSIEEAVQRLDQLDFVETESRAGMSTAHVHLKETMPARDVPQEWDHLRRRISDIQEELPPGAGPSRVIDDFGDVYGVVLALTGEDYGYRELEDFAEMLRTELLQEGEVAKVELWGEQEECVYVDISRSRLAELGIPLNQVLAKLESQGQVVDPGAVDHERQRVKFRMGGEFTSVQDISGMVLGDVPHPDQERMILLGDIASVERGYVDPPPRLMRHNGEKAIGVAISNVSGGNVVRMGEQIQEGISRIQDRLPPGVEIHSVAYQPDKVTESINTFMTNLLQALAIVIALLLVFMGMRSGLIIGSGLLLTVLITFTLMRFTGMEMDRVSLGALIIALGMIVDNAIVVTEGILVKIQTGMKRLEAARQSVRETGWPLFGATLVGVFAFMPIILAGDDTGEYTQGLFLVIAISLVVSWLLSMTVTPLVCHMFLGRDAKSPDSDPYAGRIYHLYRRLLKWCMLRKKVLLGSMAVLFALSVVGFYYVDKSFFPPSTRPQLKLDYWLQEGSRIQSTAQDLESVEEKIKDHPHVQSVSSFIGEGPPRFYLAMQPQMPNPAYGQVIINLEDSEHLDEVQDFAEKHLKSNYPYAQPRVRKFSMGPPVEYSVEVRFSGPDPEVLRDLSGRAQEIMRRDHDSKEVRSDWRQRVPAKHLEYSQSRALRYGVDRSDVARAVRLNYQGLDMGVYREEDKVMPIILRPPQESRQRLEDIYGLEVRSPGAKKGAPLGQVVPEVSLEWEDGVIMRRDRERTITAQCEPDQGGAAELRERILEDIESIELPPGYRMEWGGEHEKSSESRAEVFSGVPLSFTLMAAAVVALFASFRQPLIVLSVLPLAMIGVTGGLLATGQPFGFMALLGALSLSGLLIKNVVVLISRMDQNLETGDDPGRAILDASVSRLRPVMMTTLSTVMGMTPLLLDIFWLSMAIAIICGLTFATLLTLLVVPVLYALFFRISNSEEG